MIYKIFPVTLFFLLSFSSNEKAVVNTPLLAKTTKYTFEMKVDDLYQNLHSNNFSMPNKESFSKALEGFYLLKDKGIVKKDILTIIDFSLSSNIKRLWVIDMATNSILFNSLVSHGRNTGEEFATSFSNNFSSFKSSLGFYATAETYIGKHGLSLKLDGLEKGVNDHARARAVVVHGADYVSDSFIQNNKRLGRSEGCPAIPEELSKEIINVIKNKSCLFIYHPSRNYTAQPKLIT